MSLEHDPDLRALLAATLSAAPQAAGAVICLCADWCGTCREFQAHFRQAADEHAQLVFRWVDIEDEADALGDVDVETFPTLVLGTPDGRVHFAGPVLPQPQHITQLLRTLPAVGGPARA